MVRIKKVTLRKLGLAAILAGVIVAGVAGVASASGAAVSISSPASGRIDLYVDANNNHQNEPSEYVGNFPIYPASGIVFKWPARRFPASASGSYRIALWQNTTPLGPANWVERKVAHDFADNPAGTSNYLFGPFFSYEGICGLCVSKIVVTPETYSQKDGLILYQPFSAALDASGAPGGAMQSDEFVLDAIPGHDQGRSSESCTSPDQSKRCCELSGGIWEKDNDGSFFCGTGD